MCCSYGRTEPRGREEDPLPGKSSTRLAIPPNRRGQRRGFQHGALQPPPPRLTVASSCSTDRSREGRSTPVGLGIGTTQTRIPSPARFQAGNGTLPEETDECVAHSLVFVGLHPVARAREPLDVHARHELFEPVE